MITETVGDFSKHRFHRKKKKQQKVKADVVGRQEITLLAVTTGILIHMVNFRLLPIVGLKEKAIASRDHAANIINGWPMRDADYELNDERHVEVIMKSVSSWEQEHIETVKTFMKLPVLSNLLARVVYDLNYLVEKEKNKARKKEKERRLDPLFETVKAINNFADRQGVNVDAIAKADRAVAELYQLIGWRWK